MMKEFNIVLRGALQVWRNERKEIAWIKSDVNKEEPGREFGT